jgi:hypothetical protein
VEQGQSFDLGASRAWQDRDERPRYIGGLLLVGVAVVALPLGVYEALAFGWGDGRAIVSMVVGAFFGGAGIWLIRFLRSWRVDRIDVSAAGFSVGRSGGPQTTVRWDDPGIDFYLNDASEYRGPLGTHAVPGKYTLMSARSRIGKLEIPADCYALLFAQVRAHGLRVEDRTRDPSSPFAGLVDHHITGAGRT